MEHIGEILRTAREDNFYTQKKVIELTGINRKTLSGYENSVAEPDLDTFARLLRLYQLSADEVLGIKTSTPPACPKTLFSSIKQAPFLSMCH